MHIMPIVATIFGDLGSFLVNTLGGVTGAVGSLVLSIVGWAAGRYVIPFLQVKKRREYAEWIAVIADEVTDALRVRFPETQWAEMLDEAIDTLARICGVNDDVSERAIRAAISRKKSVS